MKSTTVLIGLNNAVRKFLDTNELPMQQLLIYLHVADRGEMPMADLLDLTGVAQSSISRNVALLGPGPNPRERGYGLIEAYEDPFYRKRKLVKLTERGKELL